MIGAADTVLRRILLDGVPGLTPAQLSFQPPDEDWRQRVGMQQGVSLNVYLCDIHEDRRLRSNEIDRVISQGIAHDTPAPMRVRLTYAVSAWNSTADSAANPATQAEHDLLSFALRSLVRSAPFAPAEILTPAELVTVPPGMRDAELPTTVAPEQGFARLAEFWSTMGKGRPLKPVIEVCITVPVTYEETVIDGVVLTIDTDVGGERLIQVGGHVLDAAGGPVADAIVTALTPAGAYAAGTRTFQDGRFVLDGLRPGPYQLQFAADGRPVPPVVPVTLPQPAGGSVELKFT